MIDNVMIESHSKSIADKAGVTLDQVEAVKLLLDGGATIPFIARYRKEKTGSLDEVEIGEIRDEFLRLLTLDSRRQTILASLEEQGVLTEELRNSVESSKTLTALEDIYLPYRPKRRTRATMAKEKGLEPLAVLIFAQEVVDPSHEALAYVDLAKGVNSVEDALSGARDIVAEWVNEDTWTRQNIRGLFYREGLIQSSLTKGKEIEGVKYTNYFDCKEPVSRVPSHRALAMFRGEKEGFLKLSIRPPQEKAMAILHRRFVKTKGAASVQVILAVEDSYLRLLAPSIETDIRQQVKEHADDEALRVFTRNLRETLMAPPMGPRSLLAIDHGYRTGCKVVCLDTQGQLLVTAIIYLNQSTASSQKATQTILDLIQRFNIEAIAIGNGTGGRETEEFIHGLNLPNKIQVVMVNESGASIYSASPVAREEFPGQDITVRGAVSIGRRLIDPLAELVKVDPKSIGLGQYQHDVDQNRLKSNLDETVTSCVNEVGVKVNTASQQLLTYVSGLSSALPKTSSHIETKTARFVAEQNSRKYHDWDLRHSRWLPVSCA